MSTAVARGPAGTPGFAPPRCVTLGWCLALSAPQSPPPPNGSPPATQRAAARRGRDALGAVATQHRSWWGLRAGGDPVTPGRAGQVPRARRSRAPAGLACAPRHLQALGSRCAGDESFEVAGRGGSGERALPACDLGRPGSPSASAERFVPSVPTPGDSRDRRGCARIRPGRGAREPGLRVGPSCPQGSDGVQRPGNLTLG